MVTRRRILGAGVAGFAGLAIGEDAPPRKAPARVRRGYAPGPFGQLHYRIARPGESSKHRPLICFHSSPNSGRIYETFLAAIGSDRVAIAVDTPGFGDSDPPDSKPGIVDYVRAMRAIVEHLGYGDVDLMGYHTGSKIAVQFALDAPHTVHRLVLVSAPIYTPQELAGFRPHFGPTELTRDGSHLVEKWLEHVHWAMPGWTIEHVGRQFPDAIRRPDVSWWGHNAAFDYNMAENLPRVRQPVLVLNPDDDLHEQTKRAGDIVRNGRVHHLAGWGHGFLDLYPLETATMLREFLDA